MRKVIRNYNQPGEFEVEARTHTRLRRLIEAECHDRAWLVSDTWQQEVKPEPVKDKVERKVKGSLCLF